MSCGVNTYFHNYVCKCHEGSYSLLVALLPYLSLQLTLRWLLKSTRPQPKILSKDLGHFCISGVFSNSLHRPIPSPHPTNKCWTHVSRIFPQFQLCIGWRREARRTVRKFRNTALLSQGLWSIIVGFFNDLSDGIGRKLLPFSDVIIDIFTIFPIAYSILWLSTKRQQSNCWWFSCKSKQLAVAGDVDGNLWPVVLRRIVSRSLLGGDHSKLYQRKIAVFHQSKVSYA